MSSVKQIVKNTKNECQKLFIPLDEWLDNCAYTDRTDAVNEIIINAIHELHAKDKRVTAVIKRWKNRNFTFKIYVGKIKIFDSINQGFSYNYPRDNYHEVAYYLKKLGVKTSYFV